MGKVIFWLVVVFVVLLVVRMISVSKLRRPRDADAPRDDTKALMVRCTECGVFLPESDAKRGPKGPCCGDAACRERAQRSR